MCQPLILISSLISAATAKLSIEGQEYNAEIAERNVDLAKTAETQRVSNEQTALNLRKIQDGITDAQLIQENDKRLIQAEATATVSAGESFVGGNVVSAKLGDLELGGANANFIIEQQAKLRGQGYNQRFKDMGLAYRNNIMRYDATPIAPVNKGAAVLQGLQTGLNMYAVGDKAGLDTGLETLGENLKNIFTIGRA